MLARCLAIGRNDFSFAPPGGGNLQSSWGHAQLGLTGGLDASEKAALESKKLFFACKDLSGRSSVAKAGDVRDLCGTCVGRGKRMKNHLHDNNRQSQRPQPQAMITSSIRKHPLKTQVATTCSNNDNGNHNSNFNIKKQQEQKQYQQQHGNQRKGRWHRNKQQQQQRQQQHRYSHHHDNR